MSVKINIDLAKGTIFTHTDVEVPLAAIGANSMDVAEPRESIASFTAETMAAVTKKFEGLISLDTSVDAAKENGGPDAPPHPSELQQTDTINILLMDTEKPTSFEIGRTEQVQVLLEKYAAMHKLSADNLLLEHRGVCVSAESTVGDLGLGEGDTLEVCVKRPEVLPLTPKVEIELIGNDGLIITFRVKGTTQFQKVLDAYAARKELPASDLRLMYAGNNVDTKSTINDLGLAHGARLDVVVENTVQGVSVAEPEVDHAASAFGLVTIILKDANDREMRFRLDRNTRVYFAVGAFEHRHNTEVMRLEYNGVEVGAKQTVGDLGLTDGAVLSVVEY